MISTRQSIHSIIDSMDNKRTFDCILNFFDPFKSRNRKTRVLDMGTFYYWDDEQIRLYDVTKTKNIEGYAKDKRYNIIVYEPPKNRNFKAETTNVCEKFHNILYKDGIIIVKVTDFRERGQLKGSNDIINSFKSNDYILFDHIISKQLRRSDVDDYNNHSSILHTNYLVFKEQQDF